MFKRTAVGNAADWSRVVSLLLQPRPRWHFEATFNLRRVLFSLEGAPPIVSCCFLPNLVLVRSSFEFVSSTSSFNLLYYIHLLSSDDDAQNRKIIKYSNYQVNEIKQNLQKFCGFGGKKMMDRQLTRVSQNIVIIALTGLSYIWAVTQNVNILKGEGEVQHAQFSLISSVFHYQKGSA